MRCKNEERAPTSNEVTEKTMKNFRFKLRNLFYDREKK
jgi:hypothetical protein